MSALRAVLLLILPHSLQAVSIPERPRRVFRARSSLRRCRVDVTGARGLGSAPRAPVWLRVSSGKASTSMSARKTAANVSDIDSPSKRRSLAVRLLKTINRGDVGVVEGCQKPRFPLGLSLAPDLCNMIVSMRGITDGTVGRLIFRMSIRSLVDFGHADLCWICGFYMLIM
jgi:hypothetical protein